MRCADMMKTDVKCIAPDESVQEAACRMRDENIGFLPVCQESKEVEGTLTDRDIAIRVVADGKAASTAASEAMTRDVVACSPEDDVEHAQELMAQHRKSRIMCIDDDGRLMGVISLSDIARRRGSDASETLRQVSGREAHA